MIIDEVKRCDLHKHGLGGHDPPSNVVAKLKELNKDLELVWNGDDTRWEIYQARGDTLYWQNSAPVLGLAITPGITDWLKKFDTSRGGRFDQQDREKQFLESLYEGLDKQAERKRKQQEDMEYGLKDVCKFAERALFGTKQVVMPGPVVGQTGKGKSIRMYKKEDDSVKKLIL